MLPSFRRRRSVVPPGGFGLRLGGGESDGGEIVKRRSKKGKTFYSCSRYPDCDYISWNPPTGEKCPECGAELFKRGKTRFCQACGYKEQDQAPSDD